MQKHVSPTKRLIEQKQSTSTHKQLVELNNKKTQDYSLHYTASPGKSYLIEPMGGEINYKVARRNPLKFYDQVMNQDVLQHKIEDIGSKQVKMTTKVTHRKIGKILQAVQSKLSDLLQRRNKWPESDILAALQDPVVKNSIQRNVSLKNIELVHSKSQKAVYLSEMKLIGQKGDRAIYEPVSGTDKKFEVDSEETELVSILFGHYFFRELKNRR